MKYRVKGLDKYINQLEQLSNIAYQRLAIEKAIEEGSKVVDEETVKQLKAVPVDNRPYVVGERTSILQVQKDALLKSFGISPIDNKRDLINDKTGVDDSVNKLGQPAVVIARRLENGTSYMKKNPVFSRASRKARNDCIEKMQESLNESIDRIFK